ncbi:MAG: T9SS type A sorting domain-containing protein, partial [Algoriphagus sp.]|nr:T9SS type A sorting domain-containing protein [Algoriphagus sp.]
PKDAYQLESLSEDWLLLYSFGSPTTKSPLVINHQPEVAGESRIIPLHLSAAKKGEPFNGTYLMNWSLPAEWPTDREVVLMDHIHQKAIDMRKEQFYSFSFEAPKATVSNARKTSASPVNPKPVVFNTPYELVEDEPTLNSINARASQGAKPKRPFAIYIGSFPGNQIEYLPEGPKLFAPVPNPFRSETKIKFFLPIPSAAQVRIYDLLGQEVGGFESEIYEAGIHELDWKPASIHLPVGMYVIQLTTSGGQFTQKLIKN